MKLDKTERSKTTASKTRSNAELRLRATSTATQLPRTKEETQRLLHELEIHQIELEMQNMELRQARNEVDTTLKKYTDLYDGAPVGYFTLDHDGVISEVNLNGAHLLGVERRRLIDRRFAQFVTDANRFTFAAFLEKVFTCKATESCEVELTAREDSPRFVQIEAVATASENECRVAVIDITGRRKLEEKLEVLHADLAARTAELETANTELEAFNYSVSHDLRRPLTVINSYCQVLQELCGSTLDDECRNYIQEMYEGTLRMNQLIDTLLDFSRITRVEIRHERVDLSKLAEDVALSLQLSAPDRRVTFRIAAGIEAEGDPDLLRVVLDNLIGNAWKYSGNQEGVVIEFGVTEVKGKPACFVRDNGPGFEMALADKLFIPFQRLPGTDVEGHGIGLATVQRIIQRHGGQIWAKAEPCTGATFLFTLG